MEPKKEEEDADATKKEQAAHRKTGGGNTGFLFFSQKGDRNPPHKEQGEEHLSTAKTRLAEAENGKERAEKWHLETNTKGNNY